MPTFSLPVEALGLEEVKVRVGIDVWKAVTAQVAEVDAAAGNRKKKDFVLEKFDQFLKY